VLAALRSLPDRQRDCLLLRYYLDLSEAEIAATLGIGTGSVKTHAHRGLAALADRLRPEDDR
jgi:RNA polymerase sigma factor (sigma-70 family)